MTHLTTSELTAWRDAPSEAGRSRIVGHLATCGECAARFAELMRTRQPEDATAHFDPQAFAIRGYAVQPEARGRMLPFRPIVLAPLAAAAAIILAVWLPSSRVGGGTDDTPQAVRGTRPLAVAPAGEVSGPIAFRWASSGGAARYAVEVKDQAGRRLFYRETQDEQMTADQALDALLRPGVRFTWTVTALDGAGEAIAQSLPRSFARTSASAR